MSSDDSTQEKETRPLVITPSLIIVVVVMTVLCTGTGLMLGYYLKLSPPTTANVVPNRHIQVDHSAVPVKPRTCDKTEIEANVEANRFFHNCEIDSCRAVSCDLPLPHTYIAYHMIPNSINVDGYLDEDAWKDVPWAEPFVDVRGDEYPKPAFETLVKLRWDDTHLFIGARLQATDVWANKTLHDTTVFQDNAFQVLLDSEESNRMYKEIVINALGTISDTMLSKPYMDDGEPLVLWDSNLMRAVHVDGPINNPRIPNKFWQVEMALPFKQLVAGTERSNNPPKDLDVWRANFVRSNWEVEVVAGVYQQKFNGITDWWVWNSPGVSNIHLPDRWGLIQFRTAPVNSSTFQTDPYWPAQETLNEIYRAQHAYKANTAKFTDNLDRLKLSPYILSGQCIQKPEIKLDWGGFIASVKPSGRNLSQLNIRTDRYMWIGDNT